MNERTKYSPIDDEANPIVSSEDNQEEFRNHNLTNFSFKTNATVLMTMTLALVGVAALFTFGSHGQPYHTAETAAKTLVPVLGSSEGVRACTVKECYAAGCNHALAPYICEWHNGGPHGGCSAIPWVVGTCEDQCDLSGCDSKDIPKDTPTCKVECGEEWCAAGQLCGDSVPYQCKVGSARFGCVDDPLWWTFKSRDIVCSECCDVTTC